MKARDTKGREQDMKDERYLVRVEAVNIYANIYDTSDLSTVRGGGLLLRQAVLALADAQTHSASKWYCSRFEVVSLGASVGVFMATTENITATIKEIEGWLNDGNGPYHLLTFVVASAPCALDGDFIRANEQALSQLRWLQQQQPTLAFEPASCDSKSWCEATGIRSAGGSSDHKYSASAAIRRRAGRSAKNTDDSESINTAVSDFYLREIGEGACVALKTAVINMSFARDLGTIAYDPRRGNLHHKLAVFYADGNRFSSIVRALSSVTELQDFDTDMRGKRERLMASLLAWVDRTPGMRTASGEVRLEVLLWGGDELLIIVPAWYGFALSKTFFDATSNWQPKVSDSVGKNAAVSKALSSDGCMTHAAGLVFCNYKTPIFRIRGWAQRLADADKAASKKTHEAHTCNSLATSVFESIDFPVESADMFRERTYGVLWPNQAAPLSPPTSFKTIRDRLSNLSRSQLYALTACILAAPAEALTIPALSTTEITRCLAATDKKAPQQPILKQFARMREMVRSPDDDAKIDEPALCRDLQSALPWPLPTTCAQPERIEQLHPMLWLQLRELWDYLVIDPDADAAPATAQGAAA